MGVPLQCSITDFLFLQSLFWLFFVFFPDLGNIYKKIFFILNYRVKSVTIGSDKILTIGQDMWYNFDCQNNIKNFKTF